jgi:hypothetical protein
LSSGRACKVHMFLSHQFVLQASPPSLS